MDDEYASCISMVMDLRCLDHSPLGIKIDNHRDNQKRPFKFYNCITQYPEFNNKV